MRSEIWIFACAWLLAAVIPPAPAQPGVQTVAVMPLGYTGISATDAEFMTERLMIELARSGGLEIMERSRRDEILREREFQQSGACDAVACLVEAGRLLAVQKIIGGSIGQIGQVISIQVRIIDLRTGAVERTAVRDYSGGVEMVLTQGMREVALELTGRLGAQPRDTLRYAPKPKTSLPIQAPIPQKYIRERPISRLRAPQLTYGSLALAAGFGVLAYASHRQAEGFYAKYREATTFEQMDANRRSTDRYDKRAKVYTYLSLGCTGLCLTSAFFRKPEPTKTSSTGQQGGAPYLILALSDGAFGIAVGGGLR